MKTQMRNELHSERGIALFMAVFALMLLSAIAAGFMYLANTETAVNSNYRSSQQAYFAARAGIEEARARLLPGNANSIAPPTALPTTANGQVVYMVNPAGAEVVQPWRVPTPAQPNPYFDNTLCQAQMAGLGNFETPAAGVRCSAVPAGTAWYRNPAPTSVFPSGPNADVGGISAQPYKWVRITLKAYNSSLYQVAAGGTNTQRVCWNGGNEVLLPTASANCATNGWKEVYDLLSFSLTPSGGRRVIEAEVVPGITVPIQSAVFSQGNGNYGDSLNITGNAPAGCGGNVAGGLSAHTLTTPGEGNLIGTMQGSPPITNPTMAQASNHSWPYNLPAMIQTFAQAPGVQSISSIAGISSSTTVVAGTTVTNYTGTPTQPMGTSAAPAIFSVPGSGDPVHPNTVTLTGLTGQGILVIDGNLTVHASSSNVAFKGLIIVTGNLLMDGGGSPNIQGAIIAGGTFTANASNFGLGVTYNQCFIDSSLNSFPLRVVAIHETQL
jgi:hypothetical protein